MDTISANNGNICSRCKKTLQSLESFMNVNRVSDDYMRSLSGSWFYHHRKACTTYTTLRSCAIESDSLYERTAKYLVDSAFLCIFCSFLLSTLSSTWSKMWKQQDCFARLSQRDIARIIEELGEQPVSLSRSYIGKSWKPQGLKIERPGNFENTITLYFDQGKSHKSPQELSV